MHRCKICFENKSSPVNPHEYLHLDRMYDEIHFLYMCRCLLHSGPRAAYISKPFHVTRVRFWSSTDSGASGAVRVRGECGGRAQPKAVTFDDAAAGLIMIFVEMCSALPSSANMKQANNTKQYAITDTHSAQCIQESVEEPVQQSVHYQRHSV